MHSDDIQWFPGHMAKTRRMITENIKKVDFIIELLDARIPRSSANPEADRLIFPKPKLILLNKASLADPAQSEAWKNRMKQNGRGCIVCDCTTGEGISELLSSANALCAEKLENYRSKGMERRLKAMIIGIPNVGKSSLINRIAKDHKTKVENRPGVTLDLQWVKTSAGFDLLDVPGILWPKFDDRKVGENLALTGAVKDKITDPETISYALIGRLRRLYPDLLMKRYKLTPEDIAEGIPDWDVLETIGRKRGLLISGGDTDTVRTANTLITEFRSGAVGRITLEKII